MRSKGNEVEEINGAVGGKIAGEIWALLEPVVGKNGVIVKVNLIVYV